jgi:hypothetical protein
MVSWPVGCKLCGAFRAGHTRWHTQLSKQATANEAPACFATAEALLRIAFWVLPELGRAMRSKAFALEGHLGGCWEADSSSKLWAAWGSSAQSVS